MLSNGLIQPTTKLTAESRAGGTGRAGGAPQIFVPITLRFLFNLLIKNT